MSEKANMVEELERSRGNVEVMREALESCLNFIVRIDRAFNPFMQGLLEDAVAKAETALATPPETPSDAARMREAILAIKEVKDRRPHDADGYEINDIIEEALAAPPRNCDVKYADQVEMYGAFKDWCKSRGHTMEPMLAYDAFEWLLATANGKVPEKADPK